MSVAILGKGKKVALKRRHVRIRKRISGTAVNVVRATVDALKQLEEPEEIAARRGLALNEVAPDALLRARAAGIDEARKAREEAAKKAAEEKDGE